MVRVRVGQDACQVGERLVSDRWPTGADLREIAERAAQPVTQLDITKQEIYEYLSRVALGPEKLDDIFSLEGIATTTASLLLSFCPHEKDWWGYLDQIWDAADVGDRTSLTVLPALMIRTHRELTRRDDGS